MNIDEIRSILKEAHKASSNLSDRQIERNSKGGKSLKGTKLSEEAKRNISVGQSGISKSEKHKKKISKTLKGREIPIDTREKMSESRTGKTHSKKTIKKLEKAAQKRCVPISQFYLDGRWKKDWIGLKQAAEHYNMQNGRAIQLVCNYYRDKLTKGSKQCKGFIWKYKK
jgi:hypothetical protein